MEIIRRLPVPTGDIVVVRGERGMLEFVSLGDYGKDVNIKCDALGLSRVPSPVRHTTMMPLTKKWVVTISTQYGCSMRCIFCDVPKVGPGKNASGVDMLGQIWTAIRLHPTVSRTDRLNIHFARMGEPTFNYDVLAVGRAIKLMLEPDYTVHPVVSTMMPRLHTDLFWFLKGWMDIKNYVYGGEAGLQLSINSTNDGERDAMFDGSSASLSSIGKLVARLPSPRGRKITLNFAVAGYEINGTKLRNWFDPARCICKLTPMHKTAAAIEHGIQTGGDYTEYHPYQQAEESLKAAGFDVLVFIASKEEDESRITCGNAVLAEGK